MLDIVINTGPLIAMVAATGNLNWLPSLYGRIVIPYEVLQEIEAGGPGNLEIIALRAVEHQVLIGGQSTQIDAAMLRELDLGESSVISSALIHAIDTVAIDEKAGRRKQKGIISFLILVNASFACAPTESGYLKS
jgi:predicted nucleic acid-binding protein